VVANKSSSASGLDPCSMLRWPRASLLRATRRARHAAQRHLEGAMSEGYGAVPSQFSRLRRSIEQAEARSTLGTGVREWPRGALAEKGPRRPRTHTQAHFLPSTPTNRSRLAKAFIRNPPHVCLTTFAGQRTRKPPERRRVFFKKADVSVRLATARETRQTILEQIFPAADRHDTFC